MFLKHNINSGKVVESTEVCYIWDNALYCLKGEKTDDKESEYISQYYEDNTSILNESLGETNCSINSGYVGCTTGRNSLSAYSNGELLIHVGDFGCDFINDGSSSCAE